MPYLRPGSSYWQVRRRNLVGIGDTGVLSSRVKSKETARRMERALEAIAERALFEPLYRQVLVAVVEKRISLPRFLDYYNRGGLPTLLASLNDPPLADAAESFLETRSDSRQMDYARRVLLSLAPPRARLSWLADAKTIVNLCHRAERGEDGLARGVRKRNTVHRNFLRFISLLLRHELGRARRDHIFDDVRYAPEDDTREVLVNPEELQRLLNACLELDKESPHLGYDQLHTVIRFALQTSADKGTILAGVTSDSVAQGLRVRQLEIHIEGEDEGEHYSGRVFIDDRKTTNRPRTVPLTDSLCRELALWCDGKEPDDPVFDLEYRQLDHRWHRVRKRAGLTHVRFKDLRAQMTIFAERVNIPLTVIAETAGHDKSTTRRYQRHRATMSAEQAAALEQVMGFG